MKEKTNDTEMTRKARELSENDLLDVAGGASGNTECYFVRKKGGQIRTYDGRTEAECGSNCSLGGSNYMIYCACHNHPDRICVNRWHTVTENGSPTPAHFSGHAKWYG